MRARIATLRRGLAGERGFTLIELLIAMTAGVLVLFAALAMFDTSSKVSAGVQDRVDNVQRGRLALDSMEQLLKSRVCLDSETPALVAGTPDVVTFYADLGDEGFTPDRHTLRYAAGEIVHDVYVGSGSPPVFPSTPSRTTTVVSNVERIPAEAIFRYFAFTGTTPPTVELPAASGLSSTDLARTANVAVGFVVKPARQKGEATKTTYRGQALMRTADPSETGGPRCS